MAKTVSSSSLKEVFELSIPHVDIDARVNEELRHKAKSFKMSGFRPGKVPLNFVRDRYFGSVLQNVVEDFIQAESKKVMEVNHIRPAIKPQYILEEYVFGNDLKFKLSVEKLPNFTLKPYQDIAVNTIECELTQENVKEASQKFLEGITLYDTADVSIVASEGHRVQLNLITKEKGRTLSNQSCKATTFLLHKEDLETSTLLNAIKDHKVGDSFFYKLSYPLDYFEKKNAGKTLDIYIDFLSHQTPSSTKASVEELVKREIFKSPEDFHEYITHKVKQTQERNLKLYNKRLILDAIAGLYDFQLPESLVENEFAIIWEKLQQEIKTSDQEDIDIESLRDEYTDIAKRRVKLGLIISQIASEEKIRLSQETIKNVVVNEARQYPGQEADVINYYSKNTSALEALLSPYLEDMVIDFLFKKINAVPRKVTREEMEALFKDVLPGFEGSSLSEKKDKQKESSPKNKVAKAKKESKPNHDDSSPPRASKKSKPVTT